MKRWITFYAILLAASLAARAQVAPAAIGPASLPLSGTLRYDLRYSETAQFYAGPLGDNQNSVLSGEVAYANASQARPFQLTYSGGDMWNISGTTRVSGVFQHLLIAQGFLGRTWAFNLKDDVSLSPQSPTTGFSGIPGVGTQPGAPGQPSQQVLALNTRSVHNMVSPSYTHRLDYATDLSVSGSYGILRFPDGNGLETDQLQISPQITRRLNTRNSIFGQYSYSLFSYPGNSVNINNQSVLFGYTRSWSRRLSTNVSAGPEWTLISGTVISALESRSTGLSVNAIASYEARFATATLGYIQATSAGGGVLESIGSHNRDLTAGGTRQFGRNLSISASGAYMHTQALISGLLLDVGLAQPGNATNSILGGVSANERLSRYITVNVNYTATHQSIGSGLPQNAINGLSQVIAFGIGYTPRELHFKK